MNKRLQLIIFLSLCLAMLTYLLVTQESGTTLHSTTGCCAIYVKDIDITSDDVLVYKVRYTQHDGDIHTSFVEEPELDSEINMYQEYCYAHHN
jgi:hypothetical protein